jgi:hypothetical protein
MSTSLQTALATEAHLAEGQFSPQEQTLNKVNSRTRRLEVSKREEQNLEPMKLEKGHGIEVVARSTYGVQF